MAKVIDNPIIAGISGKVGKRLVARRLQDGRTIVCCTPDFSRRVFSKEQKTAQERFREASAYARLAAQREPLYAEKAAGTLKNAYNIALADWYSLPELHRIEIRDGLICAWATDKIHLAGVRVVISNPGGGVLEEGQAAQVDGLWWQYSPSAPLQPGQRVTAEAWDLARNRVRLEREL